MTLLSDLIIVKADVTANTAHKDRTDNPHSVTWAQVSSNMLSLSEQSTDPADPDEGDSIMWHSDGTESGDAGDIMMKVTSGGVTITVTIVDFSNYAPTGGDTLLWELGGDILVWETGGDTVIWE